MGSYLMDFDIDVDEYPKTENSKLRQRLSEALLNVIDDPISKTENSTYAFSGNKIESGVSPEDFANNNRTAIECSLNKINLIDYWDSSLPENAENLLHAGLNFSFLLARKLNVEVSGINLKIIFSYRISKYIDSVVRFHKIRKDEIWLSNSFEKQLSTDGILTIDT